MKCQICGAIFKNLNGLGKHVNNSHKNYTKKDYYDTFIRTVDPICYCGKEKVFRGLGEGYRHFCSVKCRSSDNAIREKLKCASLGKKQSAETVKKRIKNTDQIKKESSRKKTMIERYGVDNPAKLDEVKKVISSKSKGRPISARSPEHVKKIIESKRKNGKLKHTKSVRTKISNSLNRYYQEGDDQCVTVTSLPSNGRGHKTGYYKDVLYRSSYELLFLMFCDKNGINVESCENKDRRVRYEFEGKKRWYYPDFYLTDYDICVEIKPSSMMNDLFTAKKMAAEQVYNNFMVITEHELADEVKLNEHLHLGS
jgi:hypothetical protein